MFRSDDPAGVVLLSLATASGQAPEAEEPAAGRAEPDFAGLPNYRDTIQHLRGTIGKMDVALEALHESVVWTSEEGRIQWCNSSFDRLTGRAHFSLLGKNIESVLALRRDGRPVDAIDHPVHAALRQLTAGTESDALPPASPSSQEAFEFDRSGERRHLEVFTIASRGAGEAPTAVVVIRDLTERMLAEKWLDRDGARLELLSEVALAANQVDEPDLVLAVVLQMFCEYGGWSVGHAYKVQNDRLVTSGLWQIADPRKYGTFLEATTDLELGSGHGLVGRAAQSGKPVWISNLTADAGLQAHPAALACGLDSGFAFPILAGSDVTAVCEFYSKRMRDVDEDLVGLGRQIGTQLGRVFERQRAQEALVESKLELEDRVVHRTAELQRTNSKLLLEIADRETAQAALREAGNRFQSLIQSVRDIVFSVSPAGRVESINPAFETLTGFDQGDWVNRRLLAIVHPDDRRRVMSCFPRIGRESETQPAFEVRVLGRGGAVHHLECSLSLSRTGESVSIFGIARDVTERRRDEEALRLRDRAMASVSEGILITEAGGSGNPITYVNQGYERLTGYTFAEVKGKQCGFLQGPDTDPATVDEIRAAIREVRHCRVEILNYRRDGTPFWNGLSITPVFSAAGLLTHYVGILSDISSQKEAARLKNDLVSTVSHELRTPLTSLRGFAELMLERDFPFEKRQKFLTIIRKEATRLTNLINDFLDVQRMESGRQVYHIRPINLGAMLSDTVTLFRASNAGREFLVEIEPGTGDVMADADCIRQILANLVSNALKFSPNGGPIQLRLRQDGAFAVCSVKDSGIGIPAHAIGKLFEKFYRVDNTETRKIGGTGLGLALVKQIVDAHHGRVWIESVYGAGSELFFTLPIAPPEPAQ